MSKTNSTIRKATGADLNEITVLYRACTVKMNEAGLDNWHDTYPDSETIAGDIESGNLYILVNEEIVGAVVLNDDQPPEYSGIAWEYHKGPFLVVHRLAILPGHQGKGYAVELMDYAEKHAKTTRCGSIRMDVYTINKPGRNLYRKLQYKELNEFYFPGFDTRFIGLEKKID